MRNKYDLLSKLREMPYWRGQRPRVEHAVAFPDVAMDVDLGQDAPAEIVLDARDLADLKGWADRVFTYHLGEGAGDAPLEPEDMAMLIDLMAPSRRLTLPMGVALGQEERRIVELTEEQYRLLDMLRHHRRVAISGAAGTGKTMLAREQARRLAEQGFRVLFTCYNGPLAGYLEQIGLPEAVDVINYHELCREVGQEAGLSVQQPHDVDSEEWFGERLPLILLEAADLLGPRYDAIIVDEAQDFGETYWEPLQMLLDDPDEGIMYVFYDDNQNLYRREVRLPAGLEPYPLDRNCRNTRRIHESFLPFYRSPDGHLPLAQGPEGRPVEVVYYRDERELTTLLRRTLHRLTVEEEVAPHDIVVLGMHRTRGPVAECPRLGNLQLTSQWPPQANEVYCTTINYFKGLESPVVILVDICPSQYLDVETLLYVGVSRARHHLVILAEASLPKEIQGRLPEMSMG